MQKLFENWRNYQKETLEEAAQAAAIGQRLAMAARPYLDKIGRALSKAPTWFKKPPPKAGVDLTITYGPRLNKIMGSEATGIIKYFHPNDWWAETVMNAAIKAGTLYQPAFKLMYGSLMSWNAIRQPAVIAATGSWLLDHLRDPQTQVDFDGENLNAPIIAQFVKLLKTNPTEEEVNKFLKEVIKLRDIIQPVPKTSSEKELPPSLKPGAMRFGQKI